MIIWDEGTAEIVRDEPAHVSFVLHGRKLSGGFALTRTGEQRWILVKVRDEDSCRVGHRDPERPASVRSGLTWQDLLDQEVSLNHRLPCPVQSDDPSARPGPRLSLEVKGERPMRVYPRGKGMADRTE